MPKSKRDAVQAFEDGLDKASGNPYADAAGADSISEAAEEMEEAFNKGENVSKSDMVSNWGDKY